MRRSDLNGIITALDLILVAIVKPRSTHIEVQNRKLYFAIVLKPALSEKYEFLF